MQYECPNGHTSDEPDYCTVCGVDIVARPTPVERPIERIAGVDICPYCAEPRLDPSSRYCTVCRFDFRGDPSGPLKEAAARAVAPPGGDAGARGTPATPAGAAAAAGAATPKPRPAPAAGPTPAAGQRPKWAVVVTIDPSLDVEPDPALRPPANEPERVYAVDAPETLIGRREPGARTQPDIAVPDSAVSRRHARLLIDARGELAVVDMVSTNGTYLNGRLLGAGMVQPVLPGDTITIGRWTSLRVRLRA